MSSHSFCGPSQLQKAALCSAAPFEESLLSEVSDKYSEDGTRRHKIMQYFFDQKITIPEISIEDRDVIKSAIEMFVSITEDKIHISSPGRTVYGGYWKSEKKYKCASTSTFGYTDFGTIDFHIYYPQQKRIFLIDWKFGASLVHHPKWNLQLQDYACSLWDEYGLDNTIDVSYIQPFARDKYNCQPWTFEPSDRGWMVQNIRRIREAVYSPRIEYAVGPACKFCNAAKQGTCWARRYYLTNFAAAKPITAEEIAVVNDDALNRILDASRCCEVEGKRVTKLVRDEVRKRETVLSDWSIDSLSNRITPKAGYAGLLTNPTRICRTIERTFANSKK